MNRQDLTSTVTCGYVTISDLIMLLNWGAAVQMGDVATPLVSTLSSEGLIGASHCHEHEHWSRGGAQCAVCRGSGRRCFVSPFLRSGRACWGACRRRRGTCDSEPGPMAIELDRTPFVTTKPGSSQCGASPRDDLEESAVRLGEGVPGPNSTGPEKIGGSGPELCRYWRRWK